MQSQEQVTLLTDYDAASTYALAYQSLYTNIRSGWDNEQQSQTILFATPTAYAGSAAVSANVAIAAAQNGIPTILVDANLHTPGLQQRFGIGEQSGLSNLLTEGLTTPQKIATHLHKTFIPDLTLLCAGSVLQPQEGSRLLTMELKNVITSLRQALEISNGRPGMIIFNSFPILNGVDTAIISTRVDQTFLVIASGHTTHAQAQKAQAQLERAHARLMGLIMLDIEGKL